MCTALSRIFDTQDNNDIGRKLLNTLESPPFGTGTILAFLKSLGKHPEFKDLFKICVSGSAMHGAADFNSLGCKSSKPAALLTSIFCNSFLNKFRVDFFKFKS